MPERRYDLISLGEPLLRLSPPHCGQLRRASSLEVMVVGSQLNVAANLARLGRKTAFITKLPDNPLGLLALDTCMSYGVDVSKIIQVPGGKMGATYVEFSVEPRAPQAVYDRAGSAASTLASDDYDWDAELAQTRFAYSDGILPGLSATCAEAAFAFYAAAKRQGCTTCFDMNYRAHLWTLEAARESWSKILPYVDILVTNRDVSEHVFGYQGDDVELAQRYIEQFGCRVICQTSRELIGLQRGAWRSKAYADGMMYESARREFDIIDRYGTGDAWCAGFLYSYMADGRIPAALEFGNAFGALAHTIEGDVAHVTPQDVEAILETTDLRVRR